MCFCLSAVMSSAESSVSIWWYDWVVVFVMGSKCLVNA